MRNCCRGSRQAGSPVPGEILPGRRSGQRKLPQSGCKWALSPAGGADLQIPRKKHLENWEEPQQIKELTVPQPPALFIWVSWRGQGLTWRFSLAPSPPPLCSLFYPPSGRAHVSLSINHPQIQHHCTWALFSSKKSIKKSSLIPLLEQDRTVGNGKYSRIRKMWLPLLLCQNYTCFKIIQLNKRSIQELNATKNVKYGQAEM